MTDRLLGSFEQLVLLAVLQLEADAWAVPVRETIEEHLERKVSRGALYTVLERLETKGLLSSNMADPSVERGGRSRRYYTVSDPGLQALRASRELLLELWKGLEPTLEPPR